MYLGDRPFQEIEFVFQEIEFVLIPRETLASLVASRIGTFFEFVVELYRPNVQDIASVLLKSSVPPIRFPGKHQQII